MEQQVEKVDLSKYWGILRRRYGWGVLTALAVFSVALALAVVVVSDRYEAECRLIVRSEEEELLETTMKKQPKITSTIARIEARMLTYGNLEAAAKVAGMEERLGDKANDQREKNLLYRKLAGEVKVEPLGEELVRISYKDEDPNAAYNFLEELVSRFRNDVIKKKDTTYKGAARKKQYEVDSIKNKLSIVTLAYDEFLRSNRDRTYDLHLMKQRERAGLEDKLLEADRELRAAKDMRDYWERALKDIPEILPLREVPGRRDIMRTHLERQLASLKVTLEQMRVAYTDKHPKIKTVEELIRSLEDELAKNLQVEEDARYRRNPDFYKARLEFVEQEVEVEKLTKQQEDLDKRLAKLKDDLAMMPEIRVKAEVFKRDISDLEQLLRAARRDLQEAQSRLDHSRKIKYFDYARALEEPQTPHTRRKLMVIVLGLFAAVAAGIGAMFGIEYVDQSFTDVNEARQFLMIPALGVIPTITTRRDRRRRFAFRLLKLLVVAGISAGAVALYRHVPDATLFADNLWIDIVRTFQGLFRL